jgi:membrane fusion protein (multidrug efflux system)
MYGVVTLELERRENALTLPAAALLAQDGTYHVFTVVGGKARRTAVRTGLDDGIVVEILEGLTDGDVVITAGKGLVTEGMPVAAGGGG